MMMNSPLRLAWAARYMKTSEIKLALSTFLTTPRCCSRALSWNVICMPILPSSAVAMLQEYFLPRSSYILSHLSSVALKADFLAELKWSAWPTKKFVPELFKVLSPNLSGLYLVHLENVPEKVIWCIFQLVRALVWLREGRQCELGEDFWLNVLSGVSDLMLSHI